MKKILIFHAILIFSLPAFAQWSNDFENPLIIDECRTHIDPEVVFSDGCFTFTWAENTSNPSTKRKISIFDYKGFNINYNNNPFSTDDFQVINNSVSWRNFWPAVTSGSFLTQLMRKRNTNKYYVTVLRIDKNGNTLWSIQDDLFRQNCSVKYFSLCVNENDEAFLSVQWDNRIENKIDLSIYKISSSGVVDWSYKKLFFEDSTVGLDRDINIIPSNEGGCYVSYTYINQEATESGFNFIDSYAVIYKFNNEGDLEWDDKYLLDYKQWGMSGLKVIKDEVDNLYCIWNGDMNRIQKVHPDGYPLWQEEGIPIMQRYGLREPILFDIGTDGNIRVVYASFQDRREQVYGQSVSPEGQLLWGSRGQEMVDNPYSMWGGNFKLGLCNDTILAAYKDVCDSDSNLYQTEYQMFDAYGNEVLDEPIKVDDHQGMSNYLLGVTTGVDGQFLVSWCSYNNSSSLLEAQSITTDGSPGIKTSINIQYLSEDKSFMGYNQISRELLFSPGVKEFQFHLTSMSGQVIKSGIIKDRIGVPDISPGIYVLSIFRNNYLIHSHKLLINSL